MDLFLEVLCRFLVCSGAGSGAGLVGFGQVFVGCWGSFLEGFWAGFCQVSWEVLAEVWGICGDILNIIVKLKLIVY